MGRVGDPAPGPDGLGLLAAAGAVRVSGGVGGTRATLESLVAAATHAGRAASSLSSAATHVRRAGAHPWPPAAHDAGHAATAAFAQVDAGPSGLTACAERSADVAVALRTAVSTYEDADRYARLLTRAIVVVGGATLGELGPDKGPILAAGGAVMALGTGTQVLLVRALRRMPGSLGDLLRLVPDLSGLPGTAGWVGGAMTAPGGLLPDHLGLPHSGDMELVVTAAAAFLLAAGPGRWPLSLRPVQELTRAVGVVTNAWVRFFGTPQQVVVTPLVGGRQRKTDEDKPPEGLADVVREVAELGDEEGATVGVQRLDHADGTTSWVVSVPGTRDQSLAPGRDPMDNHTNSEVMAGLPDDVSAAVETAMLKAGVGPDEPVLLAGHSQGGMVATRLARSLSGTFDIAAVVTAGSPVGDMPVPDDVAALHLEHDQDWIPALDGIPNPDAPNRTTVTRSLPGIATTVADQDLGLLFGDLPRAHQAWRYAETAAVVEQSDDPSVRGFNEVLGTVLGDGTAKVTNQAYAVARVPVDDLRVKSATAGAG